VNTPKDNEQRAKQTQQGFLFPHSSTPSILLISVAGSKTTRETLSNGIIIDFIIVLPNDATHP
jgi:hypothetical protein